MPTSGIRAGEANVPDKRVEGSLPTTWSDGMMVPNGPCFLRHECVSFTWHPPERVGMTRASHGLVRETVLSNC